MATAAKFLSYGWKGRVKEEKAKIRSGWMTEWKEEKKGENLLFIFLGFLEASPKGTGGKKTEGKGGETEIAPGWGEIHINRKYLG